MRRGSTVSVETRERMSKAATGRVFSETRRKNISEALKGKYLGAERYNWQGDKVSYHGLHEWIKRRLGRPMKCEHCGGASKSRYHWANKSGEYKRDVNDWLRLCVSCHKLYDMNDKIRLSMRRRQLKLWVNPAYRKKMVEAHKHCGCPSHQKRNNK